MFLKTHQFKTKSTTGISQVHPSGILSRSVTSKVLSVSTLVFLFSNSTFSQLRMGGKKFGVLLCAEDTDFVKKMYGGYFGVFRKMLAEEGETWDLYRVACGEFPDDDEVESYDGFVISGSSRDAHGNDAWICRLLTLLTRLDSLKIKVLGICFGHQVHANPLISSSHIWSCFLLSFPDSGNRRQAWV